MGRIILLLVMAALFSAASDTDSLRDSRSRRDDAVREKSHVDARIARLEAYLDGRDGRNIDWREHDAIRTEINLMRPYSEILRERINGDWQK